MSPPPPPPPCPTPKKALRTKRIPRTESNLMLTPAWLRLRSRTGSQDTKLCRRSCRRSLAFVTSFISAMRFTAAASWGNQTTNAQ